jgi:hypothetical protein
MTICVPIDSVPVGYGVLTTVILSVCIFCIWNGRKVMKAWVSKDNKIPSVPSVPWSEDDNNPANWYLKNPGKVKVLNT